LFEGFTGGIFFFWDGLIFFPELANKFVRRREAFLFQKSEIKLPGSNRPLSFAGR